ncbi:MAG: hypothetical protein LBR30_03100 [Clostridioides sp.]|jgi:hypothetical protein|nr:hypothetical protein [Clostridioides sp.]
MNLQKLILDTVLDITKNVLSTTLTELIISKLKTALTGIKNSSDND